MSTFVGLFRTYPLTTLCRYICSRVYLHNPPGGKFESEPEVHGSNDALPEKKSHEREAADNLEEEIPAINFSMAVIVSFISVALMALTAEILVEAIEPMRNKFSYSDEYGFLIHPLFTVC